MNINLWGVRGSCPAPIRSEEYVHKLEQVIHTLLPSLKDNNSNLSVRQLLESLPERHKTLIGGNTTCVEVLHKDTQLIIDLGTGVRELGIAMTKKSSKQEKNKTKELHILLTHTHWDHIQGWPFFAPAYRPDYKIHFYSCMKDLQKRLERQQNLASFPVKLEQMLSEKIFHYIAPNSSFTVGPFFIDTKKLIHPGNCVSYSIHVRKKRFIFATDTEFFAMELDKHVKHYSEYFNKADLLILDGQYSIADIEERRGWGHTAMITAIDCAARWKVRKLVVTHHEPAYSDDKIWDTFLKACQYYSRTAKGHEMELDIAREGNSYYL